MNPQCLRWTVQRIVLVFGHLDLVFSPPSRNPIIFWEAPSLHPVLAR
jgi:hypothetical protein